MAKFLVRLERYVVQTAVIEVDARCREEARGIATWKHRQDESIKWTDKKLWRHRTTGIREVE